MTPDQIKEALSRVKVEDVAIDAFGRVIISNKDAQLGVGVNPDILANNYGCCTNGALCKKLDVADIVADLGIER